MSIERNDVEKDLIQDKIDIKELTCSECTEFLGDSSFCDYVSMEVYSNTNACTDIYPICQIK